MTGLGMQMRLAVTLTVMSAGSIVFAQTGNNAVWDPIHGWVDGTGRSGAGSSLASGRTSSPWSFPSALDNDPTGYSQRPATIGGISMSGGSRHCGGLFRLVNC